MFDPKRVVRGALLVGAILTLVITVVVGVTVSSCSKEEPAASYELRISDEDGFQLSVPKD